MVPHDAAVTRSFVQRDALRCAQNTVSLEAVKVA
jgi:hypothetical protein